MSDWKYYRKTIIYAEKKHKNIDGTDVTLTNGGFTSIEDITDEKEELIKMYGKF